MPNGFQNFARHRVGLSLFLAMLIMASAITLCVVGLPLYGIPLLIMSIPIAFAFYSILAYGHRNANLGQHISGALKSGVMRAGEAALSFLNSWAVRICVPGIACGVAFLAGGIQATLIVLIASVAFMLAMFIAQHVVKYIISTSENDTYKSLETPESSPHHKKRHQKTTSDPITANIEAKSAPENPPCALQQADAVAQPTNQFIEELNSIGFQCEKTKNGDDYDVTFRERQFSPFKKKLDLHLLDNIMQKMQEDIRMNGTEDVIRLARATTASLREYQARPLKEESQSPRGIRINTGASIDTEIMSNISAWEGAIDQTAADYRNRQP